MRSCNYQSMIYCLLLGLSLSSTGCMIRPWNYGGERVQKPSDPVKFEGYISSNMREYIRIEAFHPTRMQWEPIGGTYPDSSLPNAWQGNDLFHWDVSVAIPYEYWIEDDINNICSDPIRFRAEVRAATYDGALVTMNDPIQEWFDPEANAEETFHQHAHGDSVSIWGAPETFEEEFVRRRIKVSKLSILHRVLEIFGRYESRRTLRDIYSGTWSD